MALFKFTRAILAGEPIDIYNNGKMVRDFTYIDDLVEAIVRLTKPFPAANRRGDSLSPVAPFRIVNIGDGQPDPADGLYRRARGALGRGDQELPADAARRRPRHRSLVRHCSTA